MTRRRARYTPTTKVRVLADVVEKESVSDARTEILKAQLIHEIGLGGAFTAPRPLGFSESTGMVRFERLDLGLPLGQVVLEGLHGDRAVAAHLMDLAGRALGTLHRELRMPDAPLEPLPSPVERHLSSRDAARLTEEALRQPVVGHGDFGTSNVFISDLSPQASVALIDSFPNFYSSFRPAARESRYLDLAVMESCFLGRGPVRTFLGARARPTGAMRTAFLQGYEASSGASVDDRLMRAAGVAVLASYLEIRRNFRRRAARIAATAVALRQIGNMR